MVANIFVNPGLIYSGFEELVNGDIHFLGIRSDYVVGGGHAGGL